MSSPRGGAVAGSGRLSAGVSRSAAVAATGRDTPTASASATSANALTASGAPRELLPMIEAFNAMLDRLAKGFAQLGQVSTDMAHELRTPINNLLGETQVALQQNRSIEAYQQLLASNVEELERLARMLDNMLFLARTDPASALRQRQELDAADEMERIADYFEGLAADVGYSIEAQGSGVIWAEPMLLRRALANLCANAIKYGAADSELVHARHACGRRHPPAGAQPRPDHCPPNTCRGCSNASTGSTNPANARPNPMAWACRSSRPSCSCTTGLTASAVPTV